MAVVVLNDSHNTFDHVAETLARYIPGVTLADGYRLADRIHNQGCAIVGAAPARTRSPSGTVLTAPGLTMAPLEGA